MKDAAAALSLAHLKEGSLVRKVEDKLREHILAQGTDALLPSQEELTQALGVSRTVLREAMKHLEAQGLIEISQGRRCRVKPAGPHATMRSLDAMLRRTDGSLAHLIEARRPLEGEIAALAAQRIGPAQLEEAGRAVEDLETAGALEAHVEADLRFHRVLAEATGNPIFPLVLGTIAGLLRASRYASIGTHGVGAAVQGHREILEAVRRRDPEAARAAMLRHLEANAQELRDAKRC